MFLLNTITLPDEYTPGHPHLEQWRAVGHKYKQRWHGRDDEETRDYPKPRPTACRVQVVRSVSDWSHGVLTERSIQTACECVRVPWVIGDFDVVVRYFND